MSGPARSKMAPVLRAPLRFFRQPAPALAAAPGALPDRAPARDRYLDLLRAIALVRVVAYHSFASAVWLSVAFPSMGVMFALAGSLMARSLERPVFGVLRSRTRRLLVPLAVYSATVLVLLLWEGWTPNPRDGQSWAHILLWFIPVADPPFPEAIGTDAGLVEASWASQAEEILWYVRAYFWFMLLSPLLLRSFRRLPWATLLAPLGLMGLLSFVAVPLPDWGNSSIIDFATYGSCWILGFAHYQGLLRRIPRKAVFIVGPAVMALGLLWASTHLGESDWDLNNIPLAQALWSLGFCAMLLRISPSWHSLPRPLRFLDKPVTLVNNRAMTIYLWHNLLLVITVVIIDRLYDIDSVATAIPWLLDSEWTQFIAVWFLIALLFLTIGWVEDVAAKRPPQIWPTGSRSTPAGGGHPRTAGRQEPAPLSRRGQAPGAVQCGRDHTIPATQGERPPATADPRISAEPITIGKLTALPLSRQTGLVQAYKCTIAAGPESRPPAPHAHDGQESIHVLKGTLRLLLGDKDLILHAGEGADFDPRVPHWFGCAGTGPVEFLALFGGSSERIHLPVRSIRTG